MSDNEIRQILIEMKREKRRAAKRQELKETVGSVIAWTCWAGLAYMMFLGTYMIG